MLWNLNKRPLSRLCKDPFSFNSFPYVYNHYVLEYTGVASQGLSRSFTALRIITQLWLLSCNQESVDRKQIIS